MSAGQLGLYTRKKILWNDNYRTKKAVDIMIPFDNMDSPVECHSQSFLCANFCRVLLQV